MSKDEIFDEDDNNIQLVKIRGIDNPIDIDAEENERQNNENDPLNKVVAQPNTKATKPKKPVLTKKEQNP